MYNQINIFLQNKKPRIGKREQENPIRGKHEGDL